MNCSIHKNIVFYCYVLYNCIVRNRPTIVYFHGGRYLGGDKAIGDPLAVNYDSNYLFDKLVLEGYNLVNVNYVLVPEYNFPSPIIQMKKASMNLNYMAFYLI